MNQERNRRPGRARRRRVPVQTAPFLGLPYSRWQYLLLLAGIVAIAIGFGLLYTGDAVFSTLALVLGYVILIPVALWPWKSRKTETTQTTP